MQALSAFANAGLSLLDDNLISFQAYVPYLLIVMLLILVGNTMYAPTLRFLLIIISRFGTQQQRFVAGYLLDHPRKCYTHLFPPSDTRWLLLTVFLFNSVEFIFFCALDWNSSALLGLSGAPYATRDSASGRMPTPAAGPLASTPGYPLVEPPAMTDLTGVPSCS